MGENFVSERCPNCAHDHAETIDARIDGRGATNTYVVLECGRCGTLWGEQREFYGVLSE